MHKFYREQYSHTVVPVVSRVTENSFASSQSLFVPSNGSLRFDGEPNWVPYAAAEPNVQEHMSIIQYSKDKMNPREKLSSLPIWKEPTNHFTPRYVPLWYCLTLLRCFLSFVTPQARIYSPELQNKKTSFALLTISHSMSCDFRKSRSEILQIKTEQKWVVRRDPNKQLQR